MPDLPDGWVSLEKGSKLNISVSTKEMIIVAPAAAVSQYQLVC